MFCQNCGHQLGDNDKFCVECGAPVPAEESVNEQDSVTLEAQEQEREEQDPVWDTAESPQPAQFSESEPHYKKNTGIIVGIVAGIGVFVMIILFACVTIAGMRVKKDNAPIFQERHDDDDNDFDFDMDDDFDFGFDYQDNDFDLGDYF